MTMLDRVVNAIRDSFNSNDVNCYPIARAALQATLDYYDNQDSECEANNAATPELQMMIADAIK